MCSGETYWSLNVVRNCNWCKLVYGFVEIVQSVVFLLCCRGCQSSSVSIDVTLSVICILIFPTYKSGTFSLDLLKASSWFMSCFKYGSQTGDAYSKCGRTNDVNALLLTSVEQL